MDSKLLKKKNKFYNYSNIVSFPNGGGVYFLIGTNNVSSPNDLLFEIFKFPSKWQNSIKLFRLTNKIFNKVIIIDKNKDLLTNINYVLYIPEKLKKDLHLLKINQQSEFGMVFGIIPLGVTQLKFYNLETWFSYLIINKEQGLLFFLINYLNLIFRVGKISHNIFLGNNFLKLLIIDNYNKSKRV